MFKKIGVAVVAVAAGLGLLSWAGLSSYTTTACSNIRSTFKKQVPPEFEIQRLRNEVAQLVPDMKKNIHAIAEEMVAIDNLKEEIATAKGNLRNQKDKLQAMTRELKSGVETIKYGSREYSANRVREMVERDFASYKRCEAELKSKEKLLEAKERALDAAREQLASVQSQKQELEVQIAQLEADLKTIRLAQTRSKVQVDDSRLARIKQTLAEIRNRLKVEQTASELEGQFGDPVPVEKKKPVSELTKEVESYLGESSPGDSKVAAEKK
jgi:DNA repair exonuclease SbcCD ATPase subunit